MTGLQTSMRSSRSVRPTAYAATVVLCLALLALLAFVQVAHVHAVDTDADHCSLCIVLHSAAVPIAATVLIIALVFFEAVAPVLSVRPAGILWHRQFFIRPPPPSLASL